MESYQREVSENSLKNASLRLNLERFRNSILGASPKVFRFSDYPRIVGELGERREPPNGREDLLVQGPAASDRPSQEVPRSAHFRQFLRFGDFPQKIRQDRAERSQPKPKHGGAHHRLRVRLERHRLQALRVRDLRQRAIRTQSISIGREIRKQPNRTRRPR